MGILNLFKPFWCKNTGRNLEWPKLSIPNLFKFVMVSNGLVSNEICTFLGFWPKLSIPNLFKFVMVSNGLVSNEICTFLGF